MIKNPIFTAYKSLLINKDGCKKIKIKVGKINENWI